MGISFYSLGSLLGGTANPKGTGAIGKKRPGLFRFFLFETVKPAIFRETQQNVKSGVKFSQIFRKDFFRRELYFLV
jgi:hypothetical protein